jgi:hypothetical protein
MRYGGVVDDGGPPGTSSSSGGGSYLRRSCGSAAGLRWSIEGLQRELGSDVAWGGLGRIGEAIVVQNLGVGSLLL